jgi:hypothetical protein
MKIDDYLTNGLNDTLLVKNNGGFSHYGPWKNLQDDTLVDKFFIGDISSAEYTISIDLNSDNKEILKCLVTGSLEQAKVVVYGRNYTDKSLANLYALVNNQYIELYASPKNAAFKSARFIHTANYFHNLHQL